MPIGWTYTPPKVNALPVMHAAGEVAVQAAAEHLLAKSKELVPVDTGALRDSGRVSRDGLEAAVSYGADDDANTVAYAVVQHEHLDFHHPNGGQAKYVEQPMHSEREAIADILAATVRKALR